MSWAERWGLERLDLLLVERFVSVGVWEGPLGRAWETQMSAYELVK